MANTEVMKLKAAFEAKRLEPAGRFSGSLRPAIKRESATTASQCSFVEALTGRIIFSFATPWFGAGTLMVSSDRQSTVFQQWRADSRHVFRHVLSRFTT
jgi:hypothetical protein